MFLYLLGFAGFIMVVGGIYAFTTGRMKLSEVAPNVNQPTELEIKEYFKINTMYPSLIFFMIGILAIILAHFLSERYLIELEGSYKIPSNLESSINSIQVQVHEREETCALRADNKFHCYLHLNPQQLNIKIISTANNQKILNRVTDIRHKIPFLTRRTIMIEDLDLITADATLEQPSQNTFYLNKENIQSISNDNIVPLSPEIKSRLLESKDSLTMSSIDNTSR